MASTILPLIHPKSPNARLILVITVTSPDRATVITCQEYVDETPVTPDPGTGTTALIITTPRPGVSVSGTQVAVAGTADPGASVTVRFGSLTPVTTTATGGAWSTNFNVASLADGNYIISVTATFTNKNPATAVRSVQVDNVTTAPSITAPMRPAFTPSAGRLRCKAPPRCVASGPTSISGHYRLSQPL